MALFLFIFFLMVGFIRAQDISKKYPDVAAKVSRINHDSSLIQIVLENEEWLPQTLDGGAALTGYYLGAQIKKISRWIGYSYGNEQFDYYFDAGKVFFIYETLHAFYEDSAGLRKDSTFLNFIGRYYFRNNKLYDNETTGHNRFEDDAVDMEGTLLQEMSQSLRLLEKKRKRK